jgi:hypothetical protein
MIRRACICLVLLGLGISAGCKTAPKAGKVAATTAAAGAVKGARATGQGAKSAAGTARDVTTRPANGREDKVSAGR